MVVDARSFSHSGDQYRLVPDYFSNENPPPPAQRRRGRFTDDNVTRVLDLCETYWKRYLDLGFISFGVDDANTKVYRIRFDRALAPTGQADGGTMSLGAIADGANVSLLTSVVIHELFHACQFASISGRRVGDAFGEGTADVATILMEPSLRQDAGVPSSDVYLNNPEETMWDRPTPGRSDSSRSTPTLFWLYFCERLGTRTLDPGARIDALRDLMNTPLNIRGDAWQGVDQLAATGRFLGNDDVQLLLRSSDWRSLGLVSANRSYGVAGETHASLVIDDRWGGGWRFREVDRLVGVGDMLGTGRDQLVVQSSRPAHLGILGFTASDGSPRQPTATETHIVIGKDTRWGTGWKLRDNDRVVAVGRFGDRTRSGVLIKSLNPAHLGYLEVDSHGAARTGSVVLEGQELGPEGWTFNATDTLVAQGDFVGTGREQFVLQSASPQALGIVGIDDAGRFRTYATLRSSTGDRFGSGWRVRDGDRILGAGRFFMSSNHMYMLIQSSNPGYIGVVGLDEAGHPETRFVASNGGDLGDDWTWEEDDILLGTGAYVRPGRDQFALMSQGRRQIGIIGFGRTDNVYTYERAHDNHGKALPTGSLQPVASGDLTGNGTTQLLVSGDREVRLLTYEQPYLDEDDPADEEPGNWRTRWALSTAGTYYSSHRFLDRFIRDRTDEALNLEGLFWEFTITNVTKDYASVTSEFQYSIPFRADSTSVDFTQLSEGRAARQQLNRWSARYYQLVVSETGRASVRASQSGTARHLYWAAIASRPGSRERLINLARSAGESFEATFEVTEGDTITIVATATYASSIVNVRASVE